MKVSFKQFLSNKHSWGVVGTSIAREMKRLGHEVHLCSTNGYDNFPEDLRENIKCDQCTDDKTRHPSKCKLDKDYDLSMTYTMMLHFAEYLCYSSKNRIGTWNIDGTVVPTGFSKHHKHCTVFTPSSNISKKIFLDSGVPADIIKVVPHGYASHFINRDEVFKIKTDRKTKVLINIQQCHTRKNIPGILESWGKAFTNKDDVVLVAKVKIKKPTSIFEIDWQQELKMMKDRYKNHAPVVVVNEFIPYMSDLYRACDIVFSASNVEMFHLPSLEGLAAGKIVIGSSWGGNVDFMNNNNSMLIKGKMVRAPESHQYWKTNLYAEMFEPSTDHAAELLLTSVKNRDDLLAKFSKGIEEVKNTYTWENVAKQVIDLC